MEFLSGFSKVGFVENYGLSFHQLYYSLLSSILLQPSDVTYVKIHINPEIMTSYILGPWKIMKMLIFFILKCHVPSDDVFRLSFLHRCSVHPFNTKRILKWWHENINVKKILVKVSEKLLIVSLFHSPV